MTDELREAFEAAFEEHEKETPEETQSDYQEATHSEPESEPANDISDANSARETSAPRAPESSTEPTPEKSDVGRDPENTGLERPPKNEGSGKAPVSWSAGARETWKELPSSAQQEVLKREREITMTLQQTAGARNIAKQLQDTLAPYKESMIAQGVQNPLEAVNTLLATESRLRGGSPQEKAFTVANLIKNYGVDIQELDNLLASGGHSQQQHQQPNNDLNRLLDERLAPVNQFLQQQQQAAQYAEQQQVAQANQTVQSFSQNAEFINDVRMEMADLMDMAAKRGMQMSIEQAYERACAFHPEVSRIMEGRKQQANLMGSQQQVQKKRAAASSITGSRGGNGVAPSESGNIRDTISDVWAQMEGS